MNIKLEHEIRNRILLLDGAMGTMVQTYGLDENDFRGDLFAGHNVQLKGNNDVLCLTRPDVILDIHRKYLEAGADIIETNTFSAQRISQADYRIEDYSRDIALAGARLARQAADEYSTQGRQRFVAGSVGPTNKTCSMSPDVSNPAARDITYDELYEAYCEQIGALIEGGVDAILIETVFDTLNAKAAIDASLAEMDKVGKKLPVMISMTVSDMAGRTLSGQTIEAFVATISAYPVFSVGLNCSFGPDKMKPFLREMARCSHLYVSAYPNAGLPNSMGQYDVGPEELASQMLDIVKEGLVNIVGGCCGTTDRHIRKLAEIVKDASPHVPSPKSGNMRLAGLEQLEITPEIRFVNVGERCNVAGSRKFLRLIKEKNYEEAVSIARKQVDDGALVIDINMDDGLLDASSEMVHFLNMIASEPDIARVPVMIDSSDWNVILSALRCVQGKCIVNSISLKAGEESFLNHAREIRRFGAAVVVMCFDEKGQATSFERRIEIAERAYKILVDKVGFNPDDIIFDPNILAIATGIREHDNYAVDFIKATKWIRDNLPGSHVSGGVSNLSFSFRGNNYIREAMHAVFLYHAMEAGMDFGIVNPSAKITYADIPKNQLEVIEDVIFNKSIDAADNLISLADNILNGSEVKGEIQGMQGQPETWREMPLDKRISYELRKGIPDYLDVDMHEALSVYPHAVDIISGPLMSGMNEVGELFGAGKMFLPQVVKTARVMKKAVEILKPFVEKEHSGSGSKKGKILIATVKGDVHDIGKNIVGVIMACNNYEVIDLGVMVAAEDIVRTAIEEKVDIVGLSGLITPSLAEMVNVVAEMGKANLNIPVMIGGATTSMQHVALKIAPAYDGPVVWMKDASQNPIAAARLLSSPEKDVYISEINTVYERLRNEYNSSEPDVDDISHARKNKLNLFG
ncbi:MAG: methionine synthase [Prevotella sp.]|nr:methionine synthase [Prevotella sp.]